MPSILGPGIQIAAQQLFTDSTTQQHSLGELAHTNDGRKFRYCQAGAVALVAGTLQQSAAIVTNHQNMTTATAAIGATLVTVTVGATAVTANQYANGYLVINAGTGKGFAYKIKSNPANGAGGGAMVVTLDDPLEIATAVADSKSCLIANQFGGLIINPAAASSNPVGLALHQIPAASFGWLQTGGPCSLLADGVVAVGLGLAPSAAVAGAAKAMGATLSQIGYTLQATIDTEQRAAFLTID